MSEEERGDNVRDATLPVLIRIQETLAAGFAGVNARLDETNARLDETNERLDVTNARLDNLVDVSGKAHAQQNQRLTDLERRVARLERGTARARRPSRPRR